MTPLMKMHTLGHDFIPDPIHAGGLRYHGMSPLLSHIYELGLIEAIAVPQTECFAAGVQFARTEGIVPAPGADPRAGRLRSGRRWRCKETGEEKVILTALCGHGHFDLAAYDAYLLGRHRRTVSGRTPTGGRRGGADDAARALRVARGAARRARGRQRGADRVGDALAGPPLGPRSSPRRQGRPHLAGWPRS